MNELSTSITEQSFPPGYLTILKPQNPNYKPIIIQHEIVLTRNMYYDKYEKDCGDGFYPQLQPLDGTEYASTPIKFKLVKQYPTIWIQANNSVIYGLDGDYGIELLNSLNKEANKNATSISNSGGRIIYPKYTESSTYKIIENSSKI